MKIERVTSETIADVLPLLEAQLAEHDTDMRGARLERALRGLVEIPERGMALVAREGENGKAIGLAVLAHTWSVELGGLTTWLDELYVIPERRNAGIGRALLVRAMEAAKAEGCAAIDLEVQHDHARVESLYLREGFRPRSRRRFWQPLA